MSDETRSAEELPLPGGDFRMFLTRLSFQGLLSLGLLENPITKSKEVNLPGAKMILDDLLLLQQKTAGNLDADEQAHMDKVVSDLQVAYQKVGGSS